VPGEADAGWADLRAALEADVRRVSDRLGGLSAAQLAAPLPPSATGGPLSGSRAHAARLVAQAMVDASGALENAPARVQGRRLPRLADFAAADQIAVTGHDLSAALSLVGPDDPVSGPGLLQYAAARDVVGQAAWLLADLRRRL
jgi:hypothetical protein